MGITTTIIPQEIDLSKELPNYIDNQTIEFVSNKLQVKEKGIEHKHIKDYSVIKTSGTGNISLSYTANTFKRPFIVVYIVRDVSGNGAKTSDNVTSGVFRARRDGEDIGNNMLLQMNNGDVSSTGIYIYYEENYDSNHTYELWYDKYYFSSPKAEILLIPL